MDLEGKFKATDVVGSCVKFVTVRLPSPKYLDLVLRDAGSCSGMGGSSTEGVAVVLLGVDATFREVCPNVFNEPCSCDHNVLLVTKLVGPGK